jgi:hypothetical protein
MDEEKNTVYLDRLNAALNGGNIIVWTGDMSVEDKLPAYIRATVIKPGTDEEIQGPAVSIIEGILAGKIEAVTNNDTEIAKYFLDTLSGAAVHAGKTGQKVIIGIDYGWLPGLNDIDGLISTLLRLSGPSGIKDVIIRKGSGQALRDELEQIASREKVDYSNILVLGPKAITEEDGIFDKMKDPKTGTKPFLAGVDKPELPEDEITAEAYYYTFLELFSIALGMAFPGSGATLPDNIDELAKKIRERVWLMYPKAEKMTVNRYDIQRKYIETAA